MHILILGASGMLGRKLTGALIAGALPGIDHLTLADISTGPAPDAPFPVSATACNIADPGTAATLIRDRPDLIFHLAAIVSGEAEQDFDKGYSVNLDASRHLIEAIRAQPDYCPRVVFASSTAVFGAPFPDRIGDTFHLTPHTSYGTQKAITELLLNDYSRRGFLDAVGLRFPTICIRPGTPNRAASGFYSNILREPLVGKPAILPVPDSTRHWFASPRAATSFMLRAAMLDTAALGHWRMLNMPGLSATVADQIEALRRVAGQKAVDLIRHEPDATIAAIVSGWPQNFDTARATALGFTAETSFDQIIAAHIADELT